MKNMTNKNCDIVIAFFSSRIFIMDKLHNFVTRLVPEFFLLFLSLTIVACGSSSVDSDKVSTAEIFPRFSALSDGSGNVNIVAQLRASALGDSDFVKLVDGDVLLASSGVKFNEVVDTGDIFSDANRFSEKMAILNQRTLDGGGIQYEVSLVNVDLSLPVYIHLIRDKGVSALDSKVTIPAGFQITSPQSSSSISRSENISVKWSNATGEPAELEVSATCDDMEFSNNITVDNSIGEYLLSSAEVGSIVNNSAFTCVLNLRVKRKLFGSISTTFVQGGVFDGIEQRVVTVTSVP